MLLHAITMLSRLTGQIFVLMLTLMPVSAHMLLNLLLLLFCIYSYSFLL